MIGKLLKMQMLEDDEDELAYTSSEDAMEKKAVREPDGRPAWMRTLNNSLATWLQLVPKVCTRNILSCITPADISTSYTLYN